MRSIYARPNALIRNFKHCSEEVKSLLFKTYCTGFYCILIVSNTHGSWSNKYLKDMTDANIDPFQTPKPRDKSVMFYFIIFVLFYILRAEKVQ